MDHKEITGICDYCGRPVGPECKPHEVTSDDEFAANLGIHVAETALAKYREEAPAKRAKS